MLLDDLVTAIQTVQIHIRDHRDSLSQNEYRTRISLVDPILNALGWDVSDPALVTIEDQYAGGRPDYALLGKDVSKPLAFIEAKRLGEPVDAHQDQVFKYTWDRKVFYAGLTDGNRWVFRDVTAEFSHPPREGLLLDVSMSGVSAEELALKLLLLWQPTLATGQPAKPNDPVFKEDKVDPPLPPPPPPPPPDGISLGDFRPKEKDMVTEMRLLFPDGTERELQRWWDFQRQVAEWLIQTGLLTEENCPVSRNSGWYIIHTHPQHRNGREFFSRHALSNGLFLEKNANRYQHVDCARFLLRHCRQDPASVRLKLNQ